MELKFVFVPPLFAALFSSPALFVLDCTGFFVGLSVAASGFIGIALAVVGMMFGWIALALYYRNARRR